MSVFKAPSKYREESKKTQYTSLLRLVYVGQLISKEHSKILYMGSMYNIMIMLECSINHATSHYVEFQETIQVGAVAYFGLG